MTGKPTAAALERIGLLIRSLEKLEPDELEYMRALPGAERIRQWLYAQPSADGLADELQWWVAGLPVSTLLTLPDGLMLRIDLALRTRQPADTVERVARLEAENASMREALEMFDDLIRHQYSGSREAMSDLTYAAQAARAALKGQP